MVGDPGARGHARGPGPGQVGGHQGAQLARAAAPTVATVAPAWRSAAAKAASEARSPAVDPSETTRTSTAPTGYTEGAWGEEGVGLSRRSPGVRCSAIGATGEVRSTKKVTPSRSSMACTALS